ncbi:MAG TPA: hypothetical protein VE953_03785 [Terriglobales bacterium]|nr:hypothetical protein [Terriglobales bacterium]
MLTPLLLYAVLTPLGLVPGLDLVLAPTAFSLVSLAFFLGSTAMLRRGRI